MSGLITAQFEPGSTIYAHFSWLHSVAMVPLLQLSYSDLKNERCFEGWKNICSSRFVPSTQCGCFPEGGEYHCPFWKRINCCPVPALRGDFSLTSSSSDNFSCFAYPVYQFFQSCNSVRKQSQISLSIVSVRYRFQTSITHTRFCAVKFHLLKQWLLLFWMGWCKGGGWPPQPWEVLFASLQTTLLKTNSLLMHDRSLLMSPLVSPWGRAHSCSHPNRQSALAGSLGWRWGEPFLSLGSPRSGGSTSCTGS